MSTPQPSSPAFVVRIMFMYPNSHSPSPLLFPEPLPSRIWRSVLCPCIAQDLLSLTGAFMLLSLPSTWIRPRHQTSYQLPIILLVSILYVGVTGAKYLAIDNPFANSCNQITLGTNSAKNSTSLDVVPVSLNCCLIHLAAILVPNAMSASRRCQTFHAY